VDFRKSKALRIVAQLTYRRKSGILKLENKSISCWTIFGDEHEAFNLLLQLLGL
jgi:hypothetical protein